MPSVRTSRGSVPARSRGSIACRRCRQAKVRCGMSEPPCPRCVSHGFGCSFDPNYRRVNNSERFEELESRLRNIAPEPNREDRQGVHGTEFEPWNGAPQLAGNTSRQGEASVGSAVSELPTPTQHQISQLQSPSTTIAATEYRSLGPTQLSLEQTNSLFSVQRFFQYYHPYLPFLEVTRTPEEYYNLSPVLSWSIVAVASRQYKEDPELLTRLSSVLGDLIWEVIKTNPIPLPIVQALLLLSCWPLPNVHLWTDKSFILNNIAVTASTHLGLHRPGRESEYSKLKTHITEEALLERSRTWVACITQAQSLSMDFGFMSPAYMNDYTIHCICRNDPTVKIPSELRANLMIRRQCHDGLQAISSYYDNPFGLPAEEDITGLVGQIEQKFVTLQTALGPDLSYINTLRLYSAKLFFQCTYLLYDTMTAERMSGVLNACSTATSLLTVLVSHCDSHSTLSYAPPGFCSLIFMAALVIFRVFHSSYAQFTSLSRSAAHVLYSAAALSMRQMSVQYREKDMATRVAEMMTNLWHWAENDTELQENPPKLIVKSRMGSSVLYDCLIIFRRYQVQRNPELKALQTGESLFNRRGANQQAPSLMTRRQASPNADTSTVDFADDLSNLSSTARIMAQQQSDFSVELGQDWDWFDLAWADDFELPSTYEP